jgi:hypothetical protein
MMGEQHCHNDDGEHSATKREFLKVERSCMVLYAAIPKLLKPLSFVVFAIV